MSVLFLRVSSQCNTSSEECNVPKVGEYYASPSVYAKYLYAGKGCDDADPETEHIRDRCDGDGHGGVSVAVPHPNGDRIVD